MGLISPGGENLLDFLELRQVLSPYVGDLRDTLWWPQESQSPCELLGGLSGFLSSGDGYVGELLELQQGCERTFGVPEVRCD